MSTPYACRKIQSIIDLKARKKQELSKVKPYDKCAKWTQDRDLMSTTKIKDIQFQANPDKHEEIVKLVRQKKQGLAVKP